MTGLPPLGEGGAQTQGEVELDIPPFNEIEVRAEEITGIDELHAEMKAATDSALTIYSTKYDESGLGPAGRAHCPIAPRELETELSLRRDGDTLTVVYHLPKGSQGQSFNADVLVKFTPTEDQPVHHRITTLPHNSHVDGMGDVTIHEFKSGKQTLVIMAV